MTAVVIGAQWVGDTSDTEPYTDGELQYRPSNVITTGGQWIVPRWSDPVVLGASRTVDMPWSASVPWEIKLTFPSGDGGDLEIHEMRFVPDSGTPVAWQTLTLSGGPGAEPGGSSSLEARLAAVEAGLLVVSGGASTTGGISDMPGVMKTFNQQTSYTAARGVLGAGTSSLALGTTSTTAKAGNYQPATTDIVGSTSFGRSLISAADQAAAQALIGASGTGTSNLTIGTTSGTAADGAVVAALSSAVTGKADKVGAALTNPTMNTQALSDSSTKGANTAFVQGLTAWAYGIQPRIVWSGIAWPARSASIPPGYTGAVEYWSPYDSTATAPTDRLVKDLWTQAG